MIRLSELICVLSVHVNMIRLLECKQFCVDTLCVCTVCVDSCVNVLHRYSGACHLLTLIGRLDRWISVHILHLGISNFP